VIQASTPARAAALSSKKETVSTSMSGSLPILFGFAWWPAVLVHPPAVADAYERRGQHPPAAVVRLARFENLAVGSFVPEESELGEENAESAGHQQLQPGVVEQDHRGGNAAEAEHASGKDDRVESVAASMQSLRTDGLS
jgi:hypothetical protein